MKSIDLIIYNEVGLHARPASLFVQTANKFQSEIQVQYDSKTVNAKSILEVLTLGAGKNARLRVTADGEDEDQALNALQMLVKNGFEVH